MKESMSKLSETSLKTNETLSFKVKNGQNDTLQGLYEESSKLRKEAKLLEEELTRLEIYNTDSENKSEQTNDQELKRVTGNRLDEVYEKVKDIENKILNITELKEDITSASKN
jgi:hypothetical protein